MRINLAYKEIADTIRGRQGVWGFYGSLHE